MASEKASNITPYSKPPSNRKFRNNLKYKGKESDFESTQKKLQNRKLDKARHKRTTKPPRERSLKSKAIESISHLIGSLVYSVIDISVTITEKLPFGPQVITYVCSKIIR
ncbi:uncharacterized protein PRCAT00003915001 [Priceomyces carsonii]|uniref:uncharacterized protein n=1 Tax=Priceomyces carsonii TaxID=28549 RepID=UPI002ED88595|nr:unnamed protein product [Priceomyces carsonii]